MGGTKDIWRKSNNGLALNKKSESFVNVVKNWDQKFDDKKLEFFSYDSGFEIGFEKIVTGNAKKIHQGKGPFIITFKDMSNIVRCLINYKK